ncbi:MAG: hypothetical protein ABSE82_17060, partial [Nitrososphaerales archaeon]
MNQESNLRADNLRLLTEEFFVPAARKAGKLARAALKGNADRDLGELLRYHYPGVVTDEETWLRDRFDYLLSFYSILEVAALIGFIEVDRSDPLFRRAKRILAFAPIRKYYVKHYRLALPQLFLKRLRREFDRQEQSDRSVSIFYNFLPLV